MQGWRRLNNSYLADQIRFFCSQFQIWITARSPRYGFIFHFFSPNAVNILLVITAIIYPWYCAHQFSIHNIIGANLVYLPVINYSYFFQLYQDLLSSSTAVCLIYQIEATKYLNVTMVFRLLMGRVMLALKFLLCVRYFAYFCDWTEIISTVCYNTIKHDILDSSCCWLSWVNKNKNWRTFMKPFVLGFLSVAIMIFFWWSNVLSMLQSSCYQCSLLWSECLV